MEKTTIPDKKVSFLKLYDLINMEDRNEVFNEVKTIVSLIYKDFDFKPLEETYIDILDLFDGRYPGYRSCNTEYHDLKHTINVFLAVSRLMHGYSTENTNLSKNGILLGLICALLHDTGYIQKIGDKRGTGAKYTKKHVERGIIFSKEYLAGRGFSRKDIRSCASILKCTIFDIDIGSLKFYTEEAELLGKMLATADFLAQMADRTYLEKLLFLFREFVEGNITGFESEFDLHKKTIKFYNSINKRCKNQLGNLNSYMVNHFRARWGINENLYENTINSNIDYLKKIIDNYSYSYKKHLKRGGIIKRI